MNRWAHERERNAIHESAHACVAILRNVPVLDVFVETPAKVRLAADPEPMDDLFIRLAGQRAEVLAFGDFDVLGARADDAAAFAAALQETEGDADAATRLVANAREAVTHLLFRHWSAVEALAVAALDHLGPLPGERVTSLAAVAGVPFRPRPPAVSKGGA